MRRIVVLYLAALLVACNGAAHASIKPLTPFVAPAVSVSSTLTVQKEFDTVLAAAAYLAISTSVAAAFAVRKRRCCDA
jgi:hypothetical protein